MKVTVEASYNISFTGEVELPEGKTWADVEEYSVNLSSLRVKFYDDPTWHEFNYEREEKANDIDYSRPMHIVIFDEEGLELAKEESA
jgi:hypothetical protein